MVTIKGQLNCKVQQAINTVLYILQGVMDYQFSNNEKVCFYFSCIKAAAFAILFLKSHLDKYKAVAPALLFFAKGSETPLKSATS